MLKNDIYLSLKFIHRLSAGPVGRNRQTGPAD